MKWLVLAVVAALLPVLAVMGGHQKAAEDHHIKFLKPSERPGCVYMKIGLEDPSLNSVMRKRQQDAYDLSCTNKVVSQ